MRTTLDIDDDVLSAAKDLARVDGKTIGEVISDLARQALTTPMLPAKGMSEPDRELPLSTWPTFPRRGGPIVTTEMVERIQAEIDLEDAMPQDFTLAEPAPAASRKSHRPTGRAQPSRARRRKPSK